MQHCDVPAIRSDGVETDQYADSTHVQPPRRPSRPSRRGCHGITQGRWRRCESRRCRAGLTGEPGSSDQTARTCCTPGWYAAQRSARPRARVPPRKRPHQRRLASSAENARNSALLPPNARPIAAPPRRSDSCVEKHRRLRHENQSCDQRKLTLLAAIGSLLSTRGIAHQKHLP